MCFEDELPYSRDGESRLWRKAGRLQVGWKRLGLDAGPGGRQRERPLGDSLCVEHLLHRGGGNSRVHAEAWSWNGRKWSDQPTYYPRVGFSLLSGIECESATSCEAVGVRVGQSDVDHPLAEHWDGRVWTNQPATGILNGWLNAISCESNSNCEAVGYTYLGDESEATLAMRMRGSRWFAQASPRLPRKGGGYGLTAVSCYVSGCTAVGYSQSGLLLAEAWNGERWRLKSAIGAGSPRGSEDAEWNAVQCESATNCTAAGAWDNGTRNFLTLIDTGRQSVDRAQDAEPVYVRR